MDPSGTRTMGASINIVLGHRAGVLGLVFKQLPLCDLKNVLLVCQLWREAGEPVLWATGVLTVTRENMAAVVEGLAGSRSLQSVRKIRVIGDVGAEVNAFVPEELLQAVAKHRGLRALNMAHTDIFAVDPELLVRAVTGLEEVNISSFIGVKKQQAEAVFTAICAGSSRLKTLYLYWTNLCSVDAVLLARAVISLENVIICDTGLTQQQTKEIFTAIHSGHSQLKNLDIGHNNLSLVEPTLLARAVTSLENVNLSGAELTTQQLEAIFTAICAGASWLKTLCLASTTMYFVEAGLLA